ncbi:hypothetical protein V6N13_146753 [Hibiscus sabdariffa]|uniref:Uncharacterized protein n=1 Tax=Hibiscus sabdariffa TaxID=183260 RepID=A0ABR2TTM0_9ROSI
MTSPDPGEWLWLLFQTLLLVPILKRIATNKCPWPHFSDDVVGWKGDVNHQFTVKFAYWLRAAIPEDNPDEVWKLESPSHF